jgi:hypothetical protein
LKQIGIARFGKYFLFGETIKKKELSKFHLEINFKQEHLLNFTNYYLEMTPIRPIAILLLITQIISTDLQKKSKLLGKEPTVASPETKKQEKVIDTPDFLKETLGIKEIERKVYKNLSPGDLYPDHGVNDSFIYKLSEAVFNTTV